MARSGERKSKQAGAVMRGERKSRQAGREAGDLVAVGAVSRCLAVSLLAEVEKRDAREKQIV